MFDNNSVHFFVSQLSYFSRNYTVFNTLLENILHLLISTFVLFNIVRF